MDSATIKKQILLLLEVRRIAHCDDTYIWAGPLARAIHEATGAKESIIERRCRELEEDGFIEKVKEQVDGKGPWCVKYRAKIEPAYSSYKPEVQKVIDAKKDPPQGLAL